MLWKNFTDAAAAGGMGASNELKYNQAFKWALYCALLEILRIMASPKIQRKIVSFSTNICASVDRITSSEVGLKIER